MASAKAHLLNPQVALNLLRCRKLCRELQTSNKGKQMLYERW